MGTNAKLRDANAKAYGRVTKRERIERRRQHQDLRVLQRTERELRKVAGVARRNLVAGAVVWAHIPYEDGDGEKLRPAIVVGCRGDAVELMPVTSSKNRRRFTRYIEIRDWKTAGLGRPCAAKMDAVEVDHIEVVSLVGRLRPDEPLMWALAVYQVLAS